MVSSVARPEIQYYFTYSVKCLMPNTDPNETGLHRKILSFLDRLASIDIEVVSFLQQMDAMVLALFSKGAVLNIFLCERDLDSQSARFWFHGNYEALVWHPFERSLTLPISHLPSLGLLSESLFVQYTQGNRPLGIPGNSWLIVWLLDQDYLHEWGMAGVVKDLWDHLLDGGSCEGFLKDPRRTPLLENLLPMEFLN